MRNLSAFCLLIALSFMLSACQGQGQPQPQQVEYRSTSVSIVDSSERTKLNTNYDLSDIIACSENLTTKMLQSPVFANAKKPPRVVVGRITNNTHDENLRVADVHDRLQEVLLNSNQVRILDPSASRFDYIIHTEITSIVSRSQDGQRKVDYTVKNKLFDVNGELKGQWSDDTTFFKNR